MKQQLFWVTGASGFIGRHLVQLLKNNGQHVIGVGRSAISVEGCKEYYSGGIQSDVIKQILAAHGRPDRVYHLAGGSTVGQSLADPLSDFESNVTSTSVLFHALRDHDLDVPVVMTSSAAVYGAGHDSPIALNATMNPYSPYGYHKQMAENICRYYSEYYSMRCTVLRLFSVYGPGIQKQLLFDLCKRVQSDVPSISLGGSGSELRDWCYVSDVASIMADVKDPKEGVTQFYNVGNGKGVCIRDIAQGVLNCWGDKRELVFTNVARKGDPYSLVADPASLPPNYTPQFDLSAGLTQFVEWFKEASVAEDKHAN